MVVQAFVFNSQRNINARVSEPRGSSSRHVTYVGSGAGWGWMSCDGKGKGESLAVYRQPAQIQIPSTTWPRGPPPLHRRTLPRSRRGNIPNIIKPARSFSPPSHWPLGPLCWRPLPARQLSSVQTRQPHFALSREQQGAMSSSKSSAVQSPAALGASNGDAATTTTSACQPSSLGPSGHSPLKRSACALTPRDTQHPQQHHRHPVAKKRTRRRRPTAPTTPPLPPPPPPPPPTSRNPWPWTR